MFESCTRNLFRRSSCFTRAPFFCLIAFLRTANSALISMLSLCFSSVSGYETVVFSCVFHRSTDVKRWIFPVFLFRKGDVFVLECGESGGRLVGDGGWRGVDIFVVLTALFL